MSSHLTAEQILWVLMPEMDEGDDGHEIAVTPEMRDAAAAAWPLVDPTCVTARAEWLAGILAGREEAARADEREECCRDTCIWCYEAARGVSNVSKAERADGTWRHRVGGDVTGSHLMHRPECAAALILERSAK